MKKRSKNIAVVALSIFLLAGVLIGGLALSGNLQSILTSIGIVRAYEEPTTTPSDNPVEDVVAHEPEKIENMLATWLIAGKDFATAENATADSVKLEISNAIEKIVEMGFNTVIISAIKEDKVIHLDGVDILAYFLEKAQNAGLYPIVTIDASEILKTQNDFEPNTQIIKELCSQYKFPALLTTGLSTFDFSQSVLSDEKKADILNHAVNKINKTIMEVSPNLYCGIEVSLVWAHNSEKEGGSETSNFYQALRDGFADTRLWATDNAFHFIMVNADSTVNNANASFDKCTSWWSSVVKNTATDLYISHRADKVSSDAVWYASDELSRQLSVLEKVENCKGSAFYSYKDLQINKNDSTTKLLEYIKNSSKNKFILKDLNITNPTSTSFTTTESNMNFRGSSDPTQPVLLNGKEIEVSDDGYFSFDRTLTPGRNTFTFKHKDKTYEYTITYNLKVLKTVSPSSVVEADGGTQVRISAVALKNSTVYAMINGTKVSMKGEESEIGSDFQTYAGTYTLPQSGSSSKYLGKIVVYASYNGHSDSITGAGITVNKKATVIQEPLPEEPITTKPTTTNPPETTTTTTPQETNPSTTNPTDTTTQAPQIPPLLSPRTYTGIGRSSRQWVEITTNYAETLETGKADDISNPEYTPLLSGTFDYIVKEVVTDTNKYYELASKRRVYQSNVIKISNPYELPANSVEFFSSSVSSAATTINLTTRWKIPIAVKISPTTYVKDTLNSRPFAVNGFTGKYIEFIFYHTTSAKGNINIGSSAIISRGEWTTNSNGYSVLRLHFRNTGAFYGYKLSYNSNGTLSISIKSKPSTSLRGLTVMLDPGHSKQDPGAPGLGKKTEYMINMELTQKVRSLLINAGATVMMTHDSSTTKEVSLAERVSQLRSKNPDLYVSIHCDAADNSGAKGTTGYYYRSYSMPLAKAINDRMSETWTSIYGSSSGVKRGAHFYPFYVTRVEECPSVLIECGFVSNTVEYAHLITDSVQNKLAQAIVNGISDYIK